MILNSFTVIVQYRINRCKYVKILSEYDTIVFLLIIVITNNLSNTETTTKRKRINYFI